MPPLGGVFPLHHPHVPLHPSKPPGPPGGAGIGVVAGLEVDHPQGADVQVLIGRKAENQGVDALFHR